MTSTFYNNLTTHDKYILYQAVHPAAVANPNSLPQPSVTHPVLFDRLDGDMIRAWAVRTDGSAGPSGLTLPGGAAFAHRFTQHPAICAALWLLLHDGCEPSSSIHLVWLLSQLVA